MTTANLAALNIGRDINGVLVVAQNAILQVTPDANGASRVIDYHGPRPRPVPRGVISLLPRESHALLGRDRELADLDRTVSTGGSVQLFGPSGIGKSTLLRHAARRLGPGMDGVVHLSARDRDVSEIAQEIFRACYDASDYVPSAAELQTYLQRLHLRIYLDDLSCSPADLKQLMDVVQNSTVVFTAHKRIPAAAVRTLSIGGLDESSAVNLLAHHLHRQLLPGERADAAALSLLDAVPRHLQRVAALGHPTLPEHKQLPTMLRTLIRRQAPAGREVLHLMASFGGGDVAPHHLDAVLGRSDAAALCRALTDAGLLAEGEGGCYRCPEDVQTAVVDMFQKLYPADVLCRHLTAWVKAPTTTPDAVAIHHQALDTIVLRAEQNNHPDLGVALAYAAAPKLQASLRFSAWGTLLGAGWSAAQKAKDKQAKAYFLHEEGVRCLMIHKLAPAALLLTEAVVLWQELGVMSQVHAAQHSAQLAASQSIGAHTSAAATGTAHAHMTAAAAHAHAAAQAVVAHGATAAGSGLMAAAPKTTYVMPGGHAANGAANGAAAHGAANSAAAHGTASGATGAHGAVNGAAAHGATTAHGVVNGAATTHGALASSSQGIAAGSHTATGAAITHGSAVNSQGIAAAGHTATGAAATHGAAASSHLAAAAAHVARPVFNLHTAAVGHGAVAAGNTAAAGSGLATAGGAATGSGVATSSGVAAGGTATGSTTGSAATVGGATTHGIGSAAALKAAVVGVTLCAAVGGSIALVNANSSPSTPPASTSATVDPVCATLGPPMSGDIAAYNSQITAFDSTVGSYNATVSAGNQGDWPAVQSSGDALLGTINSMISTIGNARSQATDPTLVSALGGAETEADSFKQNVQNFLSQSITSYDNEPTTFNEDLDQIIQACT
ncbi:AAA family ATPase [Catenulispora pinisilvae]|uniref:AAA family ATPase n=1 Tax=Catenulispora pinisilvae TaxID=2705253 RepID=UPI001891C7A1|nr:ATP-binding protein [Catenulispora pinisilvae]